MTQEKTKETEKVEEKSVSLELTLGSSSWKKLQAAMCGKTSAAMPTMPMMPIVPMMLVIPIIPCFTMYPSQMYQTAQAHQDLPIEIEGVDASSYRKKLELKVIETLKDTDFMLELCNEPCSRAAEALAETYIRLIKNGVPASRILAGWDYFKVKQNEKGNYAEAYREWLDLVTTGLGAEWFDKIKQESWTPIHKMTFDTINDYWMIGLEPEQEVPSNSLRNTIYDTDGVRKPRPDDYAAYNMTLKIINVKRKAVDNGRLGIGVVYGKETGFEPDAALKGVSNAYNEKFGKYPLNYGKFPGPLPLPQWIYEDIETPVITLPKDLVQAFNRLKQPVGQLIQSKQTIENQWSMVLPVLQKYNLA